MTYTLYLDARPSVLADTLCSGSVGVGGFECSGLLPPVAAGRHTIELTARIGSGPESPRSVPLQVTGPALTALSTARSSTIPMSSLTGAQPGPEASTGASFGAWTLCLAPGECYGVSAVAAGLGSLSALVSAGDRAFFIERGQAVRTIVGGRLIQEPALISEAAGGRFMSIAVPPDFEQSHTVFVASSAQSSGGQRLLQITRYRELQGRLGEGAAVVAGLPLPDDGLALAATDDRGLLAVALPAVGGQRGSILRFDGGGGVPDANPRLSPVIALGYDRPSALLWDGAAGRFWLAGSDSRWQSPVLMLRTAQDAHGEWPWLPAVAVAGSPPLPGTTAPALALTSEQGGLRRIWLIASSGVVYRSSVDPRSGLLDLEPVDFGRLGVVSEIVEDGPSGLLVVTRSDAPTASSSTIWRLRTATAP